MGLSDHGDGQPSLSLRARPLSLALYLSRSFTSDPCAPPLSFSLSNPVLLGVSLPDCVVGARLAGLLLAVEG